ncbi:MULTISPECIES: DinB family protein [Aequorivita]|uniref:Damage-inducible protein DinB n=1 Tax=Aequorivita iocasae TaxID=2803865 RepID=A0ABX7DTZ8_9FLAO|nr:MULTISPECIES: DinB family protein [Aequorivita]QQX77101.1 damage-inducible protein DinB [Aequorivita iocasae]UCA56586.1 DinB family protein [Aequorivita sp. F7]
MDTIKNLMDELTEEYNTTKKFLNNFPKDKNDYAPHKKSMKLMDLTTHIVDIFGWPQVILNTDYLDFADGYHPEKMDGKENLLQQLEKQYIAGIKALESASEEDLTPDWSIRMNGQKIMEWSKYGAIRHGLNQITHHRAQLGVYYRLLDIPVPGSYGPSADEQNR